MADKPNEDKPDEDSKKQQGAGSMLESAQEIWLAGLGAFAKAQREGGKIFQNLVRTGREVEHRREDAGGETGFEFGQKAEQMREQAAVRLDRLEHVIEDRLAKVLDRLDLPRRSDLEALSRRIERLEETLKETRSGGAGAAAKKRTAKTSTRTQKKRTS